MEDDIKDALSDIDSALSIIIEHCKSTKNTLAHVVAMGMMEHLGDLTDCLKQD